MKYGLFVATWGTPEREFPVDKSNLPEKCCAKCIYWVECSHEKYGSCCNPSYEDPDWDQFSYADDCCEHFDPDVEEE